MEGLPTIPDGTVSGRVALRSQAVGLSLQALAVWEALCSLSGPAKSTSSKSVLAHAFPLQGRGKKSSWTPHGCCVSTGGRSQRSLHNPTPTCIIYNRR